MNLKRLRAFWPVLCGAAVLTAGLLLWFALSHRGEPDTKAASRGEGASITQQQAFSDISYWNGTATLSFTLQEDGTWVWADDPDFPLDPTSLSALAQTLADLTPQQTLTEPDTPEAYGLDDPAATLTAVGLDGSTLSLTFGKATTDGSSRYLLMNGAETPVYIVDGALLEQMNRAIYDMAVLPALPVLTASNLETAVFTAGESKATLQAVRPTDQEGKPNRDAPVSWQVDGGRAVDSAALLPILEDLAAFSATRCVDFKPSAQAAAICGFDAPAAIAVLTYYTDSGTQQTLTLTLGGKSSDGSGRYFRINEDSTIYLAAQDGADALLTAAAALTA